eukprot:200481_1
MPPSRTVSNAGFIVNMINTCIGFGLLAKPYAIYVSQWYSIISITLAFLIISYATFLFAKVTMKSYGMKMDRSIAYELVDVHSTSDETSDDDNDDNGTARARPVFHILAQKALGTYGPRYVNTTLMIEFLLGAINIIIIEFELLSGIIQYLLTNSDPFYLHEQFIFIYIFLGNLPLIFVLNWKKLTIVGYISVISMIVLMITMLYVFVLCQLTFDDGIVPSSNYQNNKESNPYMSANNAQYAIEKMNIFDRMGFTFLIFKAGVAGTGAVPPLVIALKEKTFANIKRLIFVSYFIVTVISVSFGVVGASMYGPNTSVLVLNNLFAWPGNVYIIIVSAIKIINLWGSYAYFLLQGADLLDGALGIQEQKACARYSIRFIILLFTLYIAYLSRYHLAFITALFSSWCSVFGSTLMLPLILYIAMFYNGMSLYSKVLHVMLMVVGATIAILVISSSINGLLRCTI